MTCGICTQIHLNVPKVQGLQFGTAYKNSGHVDQFSIDYVIKLESQVPDWMGAKLLLTSCGIQIMLWCLPFQDSNKNKDRYYRGLTACQANNREEVHQLLQFCKDFQNQLWFSSMTLIKKWRVWENEDQGWTLSIHRILGSIAWMEAQVLWQIGCIKSPSQSKYMSMFVRKLDPWL
jgi:hypothetical protein